MAATLSNATESLLRGLQPLTATLLGVRDKTEKPVFGEAANLLLDMTRRLGEVELDQNCGIRPSF
ncbi:MAG: hypothetical protein REH83_06195 [Rickettsiella sp.]|nr:hypothetical protein [Rickettsiella sp.]